ncbi:MAG TPA: VanZ family protein [Blastocatellia bacterium]|nr:VanZ family protein [Blastocatellia bacterium]
MNSDAQQALPVTSPSGSGRTSFYWLPPILWMAAIFGFSTDYFSAGHTGGIVESLLRWLSPQISPEQIQTANLIVRKGAHLTVYAILALLLMRAFRAGSSVRWTRRWALFSFFIVSIYALLDEYHQTFTSLRTGTPYDSLIDMTGGALALFGWWLASRRPQA